MTSWWRRERDLNEEIAGHLRMATDDRAARGQSPEDAKAAARAEFGNISLIKDVTRDMWGWSWLDRTGQDLRYALRLFRRNPGLTISAVLTLAIGIGANTAIFAAARAILLRPLPYTDPDRLVMVWQGDKSGPLPVRGYATPIHALEWRTRNASFSDLAVLEPWTANPILQTPEGAERLLATWASPNFFDVLGVTAGIGRTFSEQDEREGSRNLIVLSHRLWHTRFGADPAVLGRAIDVPFGRDRAIGRLTVIGVLPERFRFTYPDETQAWILRPWGEIERTTPLSLQYQTIARLRPDVSLAQARANLSAVADSMVRDLPDRYDARSQKAFQSAAAEDTVYLEPVQEYVVGKTRPALILLGVATAFLLIVACANVAALLLARTAQRSRELALRVALGAASGRVRRQLFTEGLALAAAGGAVGIVAVALLQPMLRLALPASYPRADEMSVDLTTVLWAVTLSLAAAIAAGIAPSWRRAHMDPHADLKQEGCPATAGPLATVWRRGLVAIQVALVVLLMLGGGLLARTLWNLQTVDLGFNASNLVTMEMRMLDPKYRSVPALRLFEQNVLSSVRALPGVESASISSAVPFRGNDTLLGVTTDSGRHRVHFRAIDAEFFETLRILVRSGRLFEPADRDEALVLSESAAALLFPAVDSLGATLEIQPSFNRLRGRVIGIVPDVRYLKVEEPGRPAIYALRGQLPASTICLVVRSSGNVDRLAESVREVVRTLDPAQPVEGVTTIGQIVASSIADRRFYALATVGFSLVGLFLAVAGLYGVVSHSVSERVRELGVRIVLGASRKDVVRLVLRQGLLPVAAGLGVGGVAALWTTGLLRRFLFGVAAIDPATYLVVPALVVLVAAIACWIPARRASDVNPIEALRAE